MYINKVNLDLKSFKIHFDLGGGVEIFRYISYMYHTPHTQRITLSHVQ